MAKRPLTPSSPKPRPTTVSSADCCRRTPTLATCRSPSPSVLSSGMTKLCVAPDPAASDLFRRLKFRRCRVKISFQESTRTQIFDIFPSLLPNYRSRHSFGSLETSLDVIFGLKCGNQHLYLFSVIEKLFCNFDIFEARGLETHS